MLCALLRSVWNLVLLAALLGMIGAGRGWAGVVAAVGAAAAIIGVFAVAIPYAWGNYAGARVLVTTGGLLLGLRKVLWPVTALMRAADWPVRRLTGAPESVNSNGEATGEALEEAVKAEILQVASEGQAEGAVDADEMEMIESVIEFGDRRAGEIMTPRTDIVALPAGASAEQIRRTIVQHGHTRIPVHDGDIDNIIGILHAKDLLAADDLTRIELRKIMRKPFFVPETKPLDDLLRELRARKMHLAIVLDEYGGTAGMVTIEDVIEEIVGEISDEYDRPESPLLNRIDERTVEVDGRMHVDDLNDAAGLELSEDEDYDTVAGFVFSELGCIPPVGEKLTAGGATFTVLAADDRRITRLKVEVLARQKARE